MSNKNSKPEFIRRKFTITASLDDALVAMAKQHYQGNVSLCIRAAIEDHRTSINRTGDEQATEQLSRGIKSIRTQQEEIADTLRNIEQNQQNTTTDSKLGSTLNHFEEYGSGSPLIVRALDEAEHGLRLSDLDERLKLPIDQLQPALGRLVDRGIVIKISESPQRFHLAGQQANPIQETTRTTKNG